MAPLEDRRREPDEVSYEPFQPPISEWSGTRAGMYAGGLVYAAVGVVLFAIHALPGISIRGTTWVAQGEFAVLAGALLCVGAAYGIDLLYYPGALLGVVVTLGALVDLGIALPSRRGTIHEVNAPLEVVAADVPLLYELLLLLYVAPVVAMTVGRWPLQNYYRKKNATGDR